jgi:ubiquitin carboxyl-terminal hydrolase 8
MEIKYDLYKDKGLTGLANVGNSCYINSCMQLLSHTYELNDFLDVLNKSKINNNVEAIILNEWNNLRKLMWSENCGIAPWGFIKAVQHVAREKKQDIFTGYMQNDVTEFLLFIIDCLHSGLKREVDMEISGKVKNATDTLATDCYKMMQKMYKTEYSEILNIFYGISVTQIKSYDTGEILSRACEPFSILTLSLPEKETTIFECLDMYNADEELKGDNAWKNDKTNKKEDVKKNIIFWNLPTVLIVDLKRFNNLNRKLHTLVNTPLTDVDFSKYVHGYNPSEFIYDLFGIGNHSGNVNGGHYTANIKNANGKWYNFNDTNITEIKENKVITPYAYCLFYRKKNKI